MMVLGSTMFEALRRTTERLRQLRTEVALVDWRALTKQLTSREAQLSQLHTQIEERNAERTTGHLWAIGRNR